MDAFRHRDEDGIARRMRLMMRDIEGSDAEREVDRVEILERLRRVRKVERKKDESQDDRDGARRESHAGRSRSPSFRLPGR